jgi:hypothetical protein
MSTRLPQHLQQVVDTLWQPVEGESPGNVYAILDAARDSLIYPEIQGADVESACLYEGEQARELAEAAPYLVRLQKDEPFIHWLFSNGWGRSWGIFLVSSVTFDDIKKHLREFIVVYNEEGIPFYFRYYDPRVLRRYLPACNEAELKILFGPVIRYCVEGEESDTIIEYFCNQGQLTDRIVQLTTAFELLM